jgi:hypothetical protein
MNNTDPNTTGGTTRTPVNPELFRRTAPAWNCVDFPGAMHYLPSTDACAWCGMTRAEIAADDRQRESSRQPERGVVPARTRQPASRGTETP